MNFGGHNSGHNIFLSDVLCCLITFTVYCILLPTPACQPLPPGRDLFLSHWHPKNLDGQREALAHVFGGMLVSEEAHGGGGR